MSKADKPIPPHELENAGPMEKSARKMHPVMWVVAGLMVFAILAMILPECSRRPYVNVSSGKCATNLKRIGNAMLLYANDHTGRFPDTIGWLMEEDVTPDVFICPSSNDTPAATGPTTQASAANVDSKGHCSYIYLGKGLPNTQTADFILAYEPLSNHRNAGMHVL